MCQQNVLACELFTILVFHILYSEMGQICKNEMYSKMLQNCKRRQKRRGQQEIRWLFVAKQNMSMTALFVATQNTMEPKYAQSQDVGYFSDFSGN